MSWSAIRGHDHVVSFFESALKKRRLGHAYLFCGPQGIGKKTFAIELAKTLLCETRAEQFVACGQCPACKQVAAGTHPDLKFYQRPEDKQELPIETIREAISQLGLKAARGERKVVIIDDLDDINEEASNAFLKTLEEPPPGSLLLLVGGPNAETQLRTILSRCQLVRFSPLGGDDLQAMLQTAGVTSAERRLRLIQLSGGSYGDALAMNSDDLWTFRENLLKGLSKPFVDSQEFGKLWLEFIDEAGTVSSKKRQRTSILLRMMLHILRDALRLAHGVTPDSSDARALPILQHLAQRLGSERLMEWCERTIAADQHNDRNVQIDLLVEGYVDFLGR